MRTSSLFPGRQRLLPEGEFLHQQIRELQLQVIQLSQQLIQLLQAQIETAGGNPVTTTPMTEEIPISEKAVVERIVDGERSVLLVDVAEVEGVVPLASHPEGAAPPISAARTFSWRREQ